MGAGVGHIAANYGLASIKHADPGKLCFAAGQHTTVAAADTVDTGLSQVLYVIAQLESDPILAAYGVTAEIGDQAGTPAAGSIIINTWKPTATNDVTPLVATTFSRIVNWIAIGYK